MAGTRTTNLDFEEASGSSGWVAFAGYLMIVVGVFQSIAGLVAIFDPGIYVAANNSLWLLDYTQWGWVHLILGIILVASSASLFAGKWWGRFVAVTLAMLSAIANFGFIWAYPIWSTLIIVLDIFIIYAVITKGGIPQGT
ncbi:MAG TPA: hypothetical protein VLE73_00755 [Candidatus Saccharimonadales bacterium]|nr:hypothetical protein [Candidatus Saccharimonadales bacterium]